MIRRVLVLKKLDGFPVIRENMEEEKEEEMTTLDMKEIQNMAEELEVDQVYRSFCYTYKTAREQNLNEKELQKSKCKEYKWEEIIKDKGRKQGYMRES